MKSRRLLFTLIPLVLLVACGPDPDDSNAATGNSTSASGSNAPDGSDGSTRTTIAGSTGGDQTGAPDGTGSANGASNAGGTGGSPGSGGATGSGGSGGGERPRRSEPDGPRSQTVYLLEKETSATGSEKAVLKPVTVKLGISDGANTEVLEGLKEGDVVVVGTISSTPATAGATSATPFGSPFGGPGRR